jgi:hypothetical protein
MTKSQKHTRDAGANQEKRDGNQDNFFKWSELFGSQHTARAVFQKKRPTSNAQSSSIQHPEW